MYTFKPFRFWCQKVLPLVYDDSLSYYELLCKLVKYLNDALAELERMGTDVTNLSALYVQLKQELDSFISGANIEKIVENKLDEMVTDGTFDELIDDATREYLANYVDSQINEVVGLPRDFVTHRVFRQRFTEDDSALQSIAFDGTNYYFGGNILSMVTGDTYDLGGRIAKVNATSGALVGEKYYSNPNQIGHCNSMAYYDGMLYIGDGDGNLVVVDADTLEVDRVVTQNVYHNITGVGVGGTNNDKIIIAGYTSATPYTIRIAEFNQTNDTFTELCHADRVRYTSVQPTRQGFVCAGNMAYPLFNDGNAIYAINILNGNVETIITPGFGNEEYPYGELEDGFAWNGQVYLYSALMLGTSGAVNYWGEVFKTNIGGLCYPEIPSGNRVNRHLTFYVDPNTNVTNPTGSESLPFKDIEEAACVIGYLMTQAPNEPYELKVLNGENLTGQSITLMNRGSIAIDGGGCSLVDVTLYDGNYTVENLTVTGTLYATNSQTTVKNCTVNYINCSYGEVKCYRSTVARYRMNSCSLTVLSPTNGSSWRTASATFDAYAVPEHIPVDSSYITLGNNVWNWGQFIQDFLTTHTARDNIRIDADLKFGDGLGEHPVEITITTAAWNTIVGGETTTRYIEVTGYYDGKLIALTLACLLSINGVTFSVQRCIDADGNTVSAPNFGIKDFRFAF